MDFCHSICLPLDVTNNFNVSVSISLTDEQRLQLEKFINVYFLGDEEPNVNHPEINSEDYREAIAQTRSQWPVSLSLSFNHNGIPCIQVNHLQREDILSQIKKFYGCSIGCAKDIWALRKKSSWTKEQEQELLELHSTLPATETLIA